MGNLKFYYRRPIVNHAQNEVLDKTRFTVTSEKLSLAIKESLRQIQESERNSIIRRMSAGYATDADFDEIRKEVKLDPRIKKGGPNEYVYIFDYNEQALFIIRRISSKEQDIKDWEENEALIAKGEEERIKLIDENLHKRLHG